MSWWSRLLGEIPEETKYKNTNQYAIKDNGNTIKIENYSKEYQSNDAAQLFINAFAKKYDSDAEIGSLKEIDKKIEEFNKKPLKTNTNELKKLSAYISSGAMLIFLFVFIITIVFRDNNSNPAGILFILIIIFGIIGSIKNIKKNK